MFKRIDHVEITTGNLEKTLSFYINVIGFKMKEQNKMGADRAPLEEVDYLTLGDTMIEILSVKNPDPISTSVWQTGYRMMALEVDNMEKTIADLKKKGIAITREPRTILSPLGNSLRAEIKDPAGNNIELRQWLPVEKRG